MSTLYILFILLTLVNRNLSITQTDRNKSHKKLNQQQASNKSATETTEDEYILGVKKALNSYIQTNKLGNEQINNFQFESLLILHLDLSASKIIGTGNSYVVFGCKSPSYLNTSKNRVLLGKSNELIRHLYEGIKSTIDNGRRQIQCDLETNIWKEAASKFRLLVFEPTKKNFDFIVDENVLKYALGFDLIKNWKSPFNESLIVSVLKVYHHPRFFY